jgi:retron-type reverse transcriptase
MDFAKAFDKVAHKRLLDKLKYYGADTNTLNWIEDFLTLRTQTVILDGEKSEKIHVTSGVPQDTVLGPILLLVYINDFHEYIKHSTLRLFADDSILYKTIKVILTNYKKIWTQQQNGKMTGLCNSILTNAQSCT